METLESVALLVSPVCELGLRESRTSPLDRSDLAFAVNGSREWRVRPTCRRAEVCPRANLKWRVNPEYKHIGVLKRVPISVFKMNWGSHTYMCICLCVCMRWVLVCWYILNCTRSPCFGHIRCSLFPAFPCVLAPINGVALTKQYVGL
jgi:hypothetical protein